MRKLCLSGLLFVVQMFTVYAQDIINISENKIYDINRDIVYLNQTDITDDTQRIIKGEKDSSFEPFNKNSINNHFSGKSWIKLSVNNQTNQTIVIDFGSVQADSIILYTRKPSGEILMSRTGQSLKFEERSLQHNNLNLFLEGDKNIKIDYYVCIYSHLSSNYKIQIGTLDAILKKYHQMDTFRGFYYGFSFLIILLNLSVFFAQRTSIYLWYALYMISALFLALNVNGHLHEWFFFDTPQYQYSMYISNTIPSLFGFIFAIQLLKVKTLLSSHYKVLSGIVVFKIGVMLISFLDIQWATDITQMTSLPFNAYCLFVAFLVLKKGNRTAIFYILGSGARWLSVLIFLFSHAGLISLSVEAEVVSFTGIMGEVLFLMLAIVHRFKVLITEKEDAQLFAIKSLNEKQSIINKQNQFLEQRVSERTAELQLALSREQEKEEKLLRSNRELTEFASIVSHDLRAPLRNVNSFAQILVKRNRDKFDEKDFEYAAFIQAGIKQSTQLIEDLLNYSRMDKNIGAPVVLDLNDVVMGILNNVSHYLGERNASVAIENLPYVKGHKSLLTLIWQNLILNGIKYNESSVPNITVGCNTSKDKVIFWIRDNGIGIDEHYHDEIFRMFRRLHTSNKYEGTGIGLAFCKRVVEYYNGDIYFESEVGKGSTFYFVLPDILISEDSTPQSNEELNKQRLIAA